VDTAESYESSLGMSRLLVNEELCLMGTNHEECTTAQKTEALATAREKYLAMLMLDMKEDMDLDYAKGQRIHTQQQGTLC